jgi:hypothetical protein
MCAYCMKNDTLLALVSYNRQEHIVHLSFNNNHLLTHNNARCIIYCELVNYCNYDYLINIGRDNVIHTEQNDIESM